MITPWLSPEIRFVVLCARETDETALIEGCLGGRVSRVSLLSLPKASMELVHLKRCFSATEITVDRRKIEENPKKRGHTAYTPGYTK